MVISPIIQHKSAYADVIRLMEPLVMALALRVKFFD